MAAQLEGLVADIGASAPGQLVQHVGLRARLLYGVRHSRIFTVGVAVAGLFVLLALIGPYIVPYQPTTASNDVLVGPSGHHLFGTDASGLDVFSRAVAAARLDITIAVVATTLSVVLGSLVGLLASYWRNWFGELIMRSSDLLQAFPLFVLAVIYVTMAGRSALNIIIVVALLNAPIYLRLIRTQVVVLRDRAFVETARANGDGELSIAFRQVLPNALAPVWAQASITLGGSIIITAGLSFIGAGVQPPAAEWGSMIASGANGIAIGEWWMSVFPGVAMSIAVFGFAALGEGVRQVLYDT